MSDANKVVLRRYLDAYNRAAFDDLNAYVTRDYVHHNNAASLSLEQFKRGAAWLRSAIPDVALEALELIAEGNQVAARWIARGTHTVTIFDELPTNRPITLYGITVYRFEAGRIAEDWEAMDESELRRQVVAPEP